MKPIKELVHQHPIPSDHTRRELQDEAVGDTIVRCLHADDHAGRASIPLTDFQREILQHLAGGDFAELRVSWATRRRLQGVSAL